MSSSLPSSPPQPFLFSSTSVPSPLLSSSVAPLFVDETPSPLTHDLDSESFSTQHAAKRLKSDHGILNATSAIAPPLPPMQHLSALGTPSTGIPTHNGTNAAAMTTNGAPVGSASTAVSVAPTSVPASHPQPSHVPPSRRQKPCQYHQFGCSYTTAKNMSKHERRCYCNPEYAAKMTCAEPWFDLSVCSHWMGGEGRGKAQAHVRMHQQIRQGIHVYPCEICHGLWDDRSMVWRHVCAQKLGPVASGNNRLKRERKRQLQQTDTIDPISLLIMAAPLPTQNGQQTEGQQQQTTTTNQQQTPNTTSSTDRTPTTNTRSRQGK